MYCSWTQQKSVRFSNNLAELVEAPIRAHGATPLVKKKQSSSKRKQDSLVFQFFEAGRHKSEQLSRLSSGVLRFAEWFKNSQQRDLATEVTFVELFAEDRLINCLQLAEGELLGKKLKPHGCVFELVPQAFDRIVENLLVVESKRWKIIGRKPSRLCGVSASNQRQFIRGDQSVVGNCDYSPPRVSFWVAERIQLFKEDIADTGLFVQLTKSCLFKGFAFSNEATRDRVLPFKGWHASFHQQNLKRTLPHCEDHDIHGHTQAFHDSPHDKSRGFVRRLHDDARA